MLLKKFFLKKRKHIHAFFYKNNFIKTVSLRFCRNKNKLRTAQPQILRKLRTFEPRRLKSKNNRLHRIKNRLKRRTFSSMFQRLRKG